MVSVKVGLLGRLAVRNDFITMDQLADATREQMASSNTRRLGEILVDRGWLTEKQLTALLEAQSKHRKAQKKKADKAKKSRVAKKAKKSAKKKALVETPDDGSNETNGAGGEEPLELDEPLDLTPPAGHPAL